MAFIQVELDPESKRLIERLGRSGKAVRKAVHDGFAVGGQILAGEVIKATQGKLRTRSGSLRRSIQSWWVDEGNLTLAIGVPSNSPAAHYAYLLTSEKMTIRPRRARILAIPLPVLHTRGSGFGVARTPTPRDFPGFWRRSKAGNLIFFGTPQRGDVRQESAGALQPLFVGKEQVEVKGRDILEPTIIRNVRVIQEEVARRIPKEVGKFIDGF